MFVQNIFWMFLKNYFLSFGGFVLNIHVLQYEVSALRQFCRPVLERGKIIKSSAYRRAFNFAQKDQTEYFRTKGSDRIFSNENGKSLI